MCSEVTALQCTSFFTILFVCLFVLFVFTAVLPSIVQSDGIRLILVLLLTQLLFFYREVINNNNNNNNNNRSSNII